MKSAIDSLGSYLGTIPGKFSAMGTAIGTALEAGLIKAGQVFSGFAIAVVPNATIKRNFSEFEQ